MSHRHDIADPRGRLTEYLRHQHLRKTPERYAILEKALELRAHFGVDELYSALENEGYHVSRATVYNTLELLCEATILNRHLFATSHARYELAAGAHLHLICRKCGSITECEDETLASGLLSVHYPGFKPEYSSSIVYGLCEKCRTDKPDTSSPEQCGPQVSDP